MKKLSELFSVRLLCNLVLFVVSALTGTDVLMADVTVVDPGKPSAQSGQTGAPTQVLGAATTVSNVRAAGGDLIQPEIDEQITQIASDESVIDTIKRRCKRQVQVGSFEVDHYRIDEARSHCFTNAAYTESKTVQQAELKVTAEDGSIFNEYHTILAKGVQGYDPTGQKATPGIDLMLYVVGKNSTGIPIVRAVNGPKKDTNVKNTYVPNIPQNTELILLSSACYETQKFITPNTVVPVPERVYLQKQLCNSIVSDYFDAQKKRIPFSQATIAEAILRQFRLQSCRTAWVGVKGKMKVKAVDPTMGEQDVYMTEGIRWQIKRSYELVGKITLEDLIDLSMIKFTGYDCSKNALWLVGKLLLADIQKIDVTRHKDISMADSEVFGIKCTKIRTVFGDINLVHDPSLDRLGYEKSGALLDEKDLVRYWMKNEQKNSEEVTGEEAKRDIVITIDSLCLKGYSHLWVNGEGVESGITAKVTKSATLPEGPKVNTVVILTAAVEASAITGQQAFKIGDVVAFTGEKWVKYNGEIYTVNK